MGDVHAKDGRNQRAAGAANVRQTRADTTARGATGTRASVARSTGASAPGAVPPTERLHLRGDDLLGLQRAAGNRAVVAAIEHAVQRVPVKVATGETLYNQSAAGGQAGAKRYGGAEKSFDLVRNGDTGVTATVKIKFLSQARNTVPPPAGAPPGTPAVGQLIGTPTEIPAGDDRRTWADDMAKKAVIHWNGKLTLVGEEWNAFQENTKKRLPVTFVAMPVWGAADEAHSTVIVHPPAVVGGSTGNPIDAGNWYKKKDDAVYPANDDIIYAHEYGHLIGIADEYSQSNEQMNALLHEAAPGNAASSMAALDKTTIERMTLAALSRPLNAQLQAAMPGITNAIRAKRPQVKRAMAKAARDGAATGDVRDALRSVLEAGTAGALGPRIPTAVAFQTAANFSNRSLAGEGVEAGFSAAALGRQIGDAYWAALTGAQDATVAVKGLGDVKINVQDSVYGASGAGTATAGNAAAVATSTVGTAPSPAGGGGAPGLPAVAPSATLVDQLAGLPDTWSAAGSSLETGVTGAAFAAKMAEALKGAGAAAAAAAAALPVGATPAKAESTRALYERARDLVQNAARTAARQVATDLVSTTIDPTLSASVTALQATIATEVGRVLTASPSGLAAAPPDPNMAAVVSAMKGRLDAAKAATKDTGRDPLGKEGGTAPAQDVTYSYQGLMGSNASAEVRADQFAKLVTGFNQKLKTFFERSFTAEVK